MVVTQEPLIKVENAVRYFEANTPWGWGRAPDEKNRAVLKAVDGVSFSVQRGETFAIVGESGCGKSTIARMVVGLLGLTRGSISFDGKPVSTLSTSQGRGLRQKLQMIFQDPYASLNPRWRVGRIVAEPLRFAHPSMKEPAIQERVDALLKRVGLSAEDKEKFPHEFSGGQRQRISIARALAAEPDFLVCDEPTSALDVSVQAQVLNLMKDLQREMGLAYLFISHNLALVAHIADQVGVMYCGRLVEVATKEALFSAPQHPYTRMLLNAAADTASSSAEANVVGQVPDPMNPPSGCPFHPRCPLARERCKKEMPALLAHGTTVVACHAVEEGWTN